MPTDRNWHHKLTKSRQALALLPHQPGTDNQIDWRGVDIAHLDTGCTRHSCFGAWRGDDNPTLQVARGLNLIEAGQPPFDPLSYSGFLTYPGHGTRTGSALCAAVPGILLGAAPGLPTVPYRVSNSVQITSLPTQKRLAAAIRHAVDHAACEVISISLGTPLLRLFSNPLGEAVDHAYDRGVIVVAAAGQGVDRVTYPGKFFRSIGVGGVLEDRRVYEPHATADPEGEDFGDFIDVWAPADPIWRANSVFRDGVVVEDGLDFGDGTSYATVQVAAAAAMWLAYHGPDKIGAAYPKPWQRIEAFRALLKATGQDVAGPPEPRNGSGILDMQALLLSDLPAVGDDAFDDRLAAGQWG